MENVFLVKKMYLMKKTYFLFGCNIENASEFFFNVKLTWKIINISSSHISGWGGGKNKKYK